MASELITEEPPQAAFALGGSGTAPATKSPFGGRVPIMAAASASSPAFGAAFAAEAAAGASYDDDNGSSSGSCLLYTSDAADE